MQFALSKKKKKKINSCGGPSRFILRRRSILATAEVPEASDASITFVAKLSKSPSKKNTSFAGHGEILRSKNL